jgi:hypothetical protein
MNHSSKRILFTVFSLISFVMFGCVSPFSESPGVTSTVSLAAQAGMITGGTAGNVTFAASTTNIADGTTGTISWFTSSDGATAGSAPSGVTPTVSAVTSNASTIVMTATTSTMAGSYYFKVTYGSATSTIATLTIVAATTPGGGTTPIVNIASQSGILTSGTAGSATFAASTVNIADGTTGTISWYTSSDGTTAGSAPSGITPTVSAVAGNASTVNMTATMAIMAGSYYFKASFGSATSSVATLTIGAAITPAINIAPQSGILTSGTTGNATFAVITANIPDGTTGTVSWYTSSDGTTAGLVPSGTTPSVAHVASNASTVTIAATTAALAGSYYFKVTYGSTTSSVATLTIGLAPIPTIILEAQVGTITSGTAGSSSYSATTTNIADGSTGAIT